VLSGKGRCSFRPQRVGHPSFAPDGAKELGPGAITAAGPFLVDSALLGQAAGRLLKCRGGRGGLGVPFAAGRLAAYS
jgi:hypothetical protein